MKTRTLRIAVGLFFLLSVAELAAAAKVVTDFNPKVNFSHYKTFM